MYPRALEAWTRCCSNNRTRWARPHARKSTLRRKPLNAPGNCPPERLPGQFSIRSQALCACPTASWLPALRVVQQHHQPKTQCANSKRRHKQTNYRDAKQNYSLKRGEFFFLFPLAAACIRLSDCLGPSSACLVARLKADHQKKGRTTSVSLSVGTRMCIMVHPCAFLGAPCFWWSERKHFAIAVPEREEGILAAS